MCYQLIRTVDEFKAIEIDYTKPLFCDTETMEEQGKTKPKGGLYGLVRLMQIYQTGWKKAILIDCYFVDLNAVLSLLKPCHTVWHNASYDIHTINCHTEDFWYPAKVDDTFYLAKAKYTDKQKFGYYDCLAHAGLSDATIRGIDKKANQKADWSKLMTEEMKLYAAYDVLYLSLLYAKMEDAKDEPYELDIKNLEYMIRSSRRGLPINQDCIAEIRQEQMIRLEEAMNHVPVNPNSPKQCKEWLGTASTDADTLANEALRGNENAKQLLKARKSGKILSFLDQYDRPRIRAFHNACGARIC